MVKRAAKPEPTSEQNSALRPRGSAPFEVECVRFQGESAPWGELRAALLGWYAQHKRELPWRQDTDVYRVWVSEIMLQQTRVAAVLDHYRVFLNTLPTIEALASAPEQQVLALWSGLGYYRRARMLHRAAQLVVSDLGGVIPRSAESLRMLPGVGRYTASALASICFGEAVAVVDGNVERVLSRVDGEPRADASAWKRAQELLDRRHPGDWNQAMMELGATVCTPQNPQCLVCPIHTWCRAPGSETNKPRAACKRVQMTRALIERSHCVYLVQRRADAAKMAGMWELPESVTFDSTQNAGRGAKELCVVRHSITDTNYEVRVVSVGLKALGVEEKKSGRWVPCKEIWQLPLTGLTRKILRKQGL
jgi:A/G-specific adenine glycosylase